MILLIEVLAQATVAGASTMQGSAASFPSLSDNAWSALMGAFVGAIAGGLATWFVEMDSRRRDGDVHRERERQDRQRIARGILFKLIIIASNYRQWTRAFEDAFASAEAAQMDLTEPWRFVLPLGGLPDTVHFTSEELTMVAELGLDGLVNPMLTLDRAHNQVRAILGDYRVKRAEIQLMLRDGIPAAAGGRAGRVALTPQQEAALRPLATEANDLALYLRKFSADDAATSRRLLDAARDGFATKLNLAVKLEDVSENNGQRKAAE